MKMPVFTVLGTISCIYRRCKRVRVKSVSNFWYYGYGNSENTVRCDQKQVR